MKEIPLTHFKFALVDDEDFIRVNALSWHAYFHHGIWYAKHTTPHANGKQRTIRLHHFVLGLEPPFPLIDHKDRDGLNCQKANLRFATPSQNSTNRIGYSRTGFKGVYFQPRSHIRPWQAYIRIGGKGHSLGYFANPADAARAYDKAATKEYGEFARLNFGGI